MISVCYKPYLVTRQVIDELNKRKRIDHFKAIAGMTDREAFDPVELNSWEKDVHCWKADRHVLRRVAERAMALAGESAKSSGDVDLTRRSLTSPTLQTALQINRPT